MNGEKIFSIGFWVVAVALIGGCVYWLDQDKKTAQASASVRKQADLKDEIALQRALAKPPTVREWQLNGGVLREIQIPKASIAQTLEFKVCYLWIDQNKSSTMHCDQETKLDLLASE